MAADGSIIDQGLALYFPAPHSYTGEDVLELQGHGGPVVLQMLLARCLEAGQSIGLRLAQPGEFTQRAYLNDKLDLAQAEAVADLIDASTEAAARSASQSLAGAFSSARPEAMTLCWGASGFPSGAEPRSPVRVEQCGDRERRSPPTPLCRAFDRHVRAFSCLGLFAILGAFRVRIR